MEDGRIELADVERAAEIYGLIRPLLESYSLVLTEAARLEGEAPATRDWIRTLQDDRDALLVTGRISRPEALSMVSLQNAVISFVEEGVIDRADDKLRDAPEIRKPRASAFAELVR